MNEFSIKPELITKEMMEQFVAYLQSRSVGEGAKSIYQRFKKVIRYAIEHDVILKDPCKDVTCYSDLVSRIGYPFTVFTIRSHCNDTRCRQYCIMTDILHLFIINL